MNQRKIVEITKKLTNMEIKYNDALEWHNKGANFDTNLLESIGLVWRKLMRDMLDAIEDIPEVAWTRCEALDHSTEHADHCREWEKKRFEAHEECSSKEDSSIKTKLNSIITLLYQTQQTVEKIAEGK
jgi:hypothetical protein